ncbi:uncharacterized protein [Patagioenas fasciata]|uniref:uncharacterized protein isoform X4 n=1 Tax=Patagioenas fasciata TaxID=372321 RepID=UPI003A9947E1
MGPGRLGPCASTERRLQQRDPGVREGPRSAPRDPGVREGPRSAPGTQASGQLLVSGSLLVTLDKKPRVGTARVGVAVGGVSSCCLLLALLGQGLSLGLGHQCPQCHQLGPAGTVALLGVQVLLLLMGVAGAGLAVTGTVVAGRGGAKGEGPPMVIYQTALPGAGLAETTPPAPTPQ